VTAEDEEEFVALARDSVDLHRGLIFAPTRPDEFAEYLARFDGVNAIGLVVRLNSTRRLAGLVNITDIVRDDPQPRASLGYGGFAATAGHGYVAEAVHLVVRYAFEELGLVRLDAYVQDDNAASRKVVTQAGFRHVPSDRSTVHIAGEVREHVRWTLTSDGGAA
jgi:[ribosomal protein S5]-alanine N-acetyltransferase